MSWRVFLSRPSALSPGQRSAFRSWCSELARRGLELRTLPRHEYVSDPWALMRELFQGVDGVVIFGFRQVEVTDGFLCAGTDEERPAPAALASAWTQIEAGLAVSAGLPLLALAECGVSEGIFDPTTWGTQVIGHELSATPAHNALDAFVIALELQDQCARWRFSQFPGELQR